jgi:hypothetical protein
LPKNDITSGGISSLITLQTFYQNETGAAAGGAPGSLSRNGHCSYLTAIILAVFTDLSVVRVTKYIPRARAGTRTVPEDSVRGISHITFPLQEHKDSRAFGMPP